MIDWRPNKTTAKKKLEIIELYKEGMATPELGRQFGISRQSVYRLLKRRNITIRPQTVCQRRYSLNEKFFDKVDLEERAYFITCFSLSGRKQILKFLKRLYKDATVYLKRKHDKYLELLNYYNAREN